LDPDNITLTEEKVLRFVDNIGSILKNRPSAALYLFGDKPTLLDAHAAAFLARLIDLQRLDFLSNPLVRDYVLGITSTTEWQHITQGLRTVSDESVESVEGLNLT
jgi:glutathione S-transferase